MSSRVEAAIRAANDSGRGALVAYLPAGYPSIDESIEAVVALADAGADIIELGIPYSDPVMDGVVIQRATNAALENGFRVRHVFDIVRAVTARTSVPVLVMTYWNPVVQYGVERFATDLKAAGGAGLITPDLIPDEASNWLAVSEDLALDRVFLATPSSSPERVAAACAKSRGFVYAVSTMGITGARAELDAKARAVVSAVREADADALTCVGIGVSTPDQVSEINGYADGAIVGSAFVRAYQDGGIDALVAKVRELRANLK